MTLIDDTELARLREQEAGAAAMREALSQAERQIRFGHDCTDTCTRVISNAQTALATNAGRELLAEVERLRALTGTIACAFCDFKTSNQNFDGLWKEANE